MIDREQYPNTMASFLYVISVKLSDYDFYPKKHIYTAPKNLSLPVIRHSVD